MLDLSFSRHRSPISSGGMALQGASNRAAKSKLNSGGCLCGAIRFGAIGPAEKPHTCSCKMCQRHTDVLTTAWVEFRSNR